MSMDPSARMGAVRLRVGDLPRMKAFYERAVGLEELPRDSDVVTLGVGSEPLVELLEDPAAPLRPPRATGLFHLAIVVPDRPSLGDAIRRVLDAGWTFTGAADHLVSEAMYLDDPEGNGIELYRDRPRMQWAYEGDQIAMATLPLDIESVINDGASADGGMPEGTHMGHVHLQVSELEETEAFYSGVLGFDVTVRGYPGALFVSAGGYHHHLGLNTWVSSGSGPPSVTSRGLEHYEVVVSERTEIHRIGTALGRAGREHARDDRGLWATDPSGNKLLVRT